MKKITLFLCLAFAIVLYSLSVNAVYVPPCGPSSPPPWCAGNACGTKECITLYEAQEKTASSKCGADYSSCAMAIPTVNGCGPGTVLYTCSSSDGSFPSCQTPTCIQTCQQAATSKYIPIESTANNLAQSWIDEILGSGLFDSRVLCGEMNSCILKGSAFDSPQRLEDCSQALNLESYEKVLSEYCESGSCEQYLNYENPDVSTALKSTSYEFKSEEFLSKYITTEGQGTEALTEHLTLQDTDLLAKETVREAMAKTGAELRWWKQAWVYVKVFKQSTVGKIISYGKTVVSAVKQLFTLNNEEAQSSAASNIVQASAYAGNGLSSWGFCNDPRHGIIGPDCVLEGGSSQLAYEGTSMTFSSIHLIDNANNNMYTISGNGNKGIVFMPDGTANIHGTGTTVVSVGGEGTFVSDTKGNKLMFYGGTHNYFGLGTEETDTYLSDSIIHDTLASILFDATKDRGGDEFGKISLKKLTGKIVSAINYKPIDGQLAASFDHFTLPDFQNAVDLGKTAEGYQLLARGFGDMVLLGQEKFFPLLVRNVLKGDSGIIFNKDVKIINTYVARDNIYDYIIISDNKSTKVIARNSKVIEDSSGLPLELTPRQSDLVYG